MKVGICLLVVFLAFAIAARLERPIPFKTPASEHLLDPGVRNPPMRQVADTWPIPPGTRLWFHADRSSFARIVQVERDSALVQWNSGGSSWVKRKHLRNAWVPQTKETTAHTK